MCKGNQLTGFYMRATLAFKGLNSSIENAASSIKSNENSFVINDKHKNIQDSIEKIIVKY